MFKNLSKWFVKFILRDKILLIIIRYSKAQKCSDLCQSQGRTRQLCIPQASSRFLHWSCQASSQTVPWVPWVLIGHRDQMKNKITMEGIIKITIPLPNLVSSSRRKREILGTISHKKINKQTLSTFRMGIRIKIMKAMRKELRN